MNFNLYLDEDSARRLAQLAKRTGVPRNAIVRKAVREWLDAQSSVWPKEVQEFPGDPALVPFESRRSELRAAEDDPFSLSEPSRAKQQAVRKRRAGK